MKQTDLSLREKHYLLSFLGADLESIADFLNAHSEEISEEFFNEFYSSFRNIVDGVSASLGFEFV